MLVPCVRMAKKRSRVKDFLWPASKRRRSGKIRRRHARGADAELGARDQAPLLAEQANALNALLQFNTAYHHFVAVDKARVAYGVGARLGGNEGKAITPHLKIAKESLPKVRHKTTKALLSEFEAPAQTK